MLQDRQMESRPKQMTIAWARWCCYSGNQRNDIVLTPVLTGCLVLLTNEFSLLFATKIVPKQSANRLWALRGETEIVEEHELWDTQRVFKHPKRKHFVSRVAVSNEVCNFVTRLLWLPQKETHRFNLPSILANSLLSLLYSTASVFGCNRSQHQTEMRTVCAKESPRYKV